MASSSPPRGSSEKAKAQDASSASGTDIWNPIMVDDLPPQDHTNISSPKAVQTSSADAAAESERRARIAKGKQPMELANLPPGIDQASDITEAGLSAITAADYNTAVECLLASRDLRVGHYGEYSPECLAAHCQYVAAIILKHCNVPAPTTPKPRDAPAAGSGKKEDLKADKGKAADLNPDLAWKVLGVAKAISETQSTARKLEMLSREMAQKDAEDTIEKADILSSCGDAAMKRKDFQTARGDYEKALSIVELTPNSYSRRIAELNLSISLCFEAEANLEKAILSCCKASLACQYGQKLLEDDLQSPEGSDGHSTSTSDLSPKSDDPSGGEVPEMDKEAQLGLLTGLSEHIDKKLQELRQGNFQLISCKPSAPSDMSDTRKAIIVDSSSDSVNQQGRGGKEPRREIKDTAESPSKKPKPDSPSGKGTAS